MPPEAPVSPAISAKILHAALVLGVILFYVVAWYVGTKTSMPISAVPERRVLYVGLFLVSAIVFGLPCTPPAVSRRPAPVPRRTTGGEPTWVGPS